MSEQSANSGGQVTPIDPATKRAVTGSLTITPDQTALTPEQKAAFASLGIDPSDPVARAHIRRFVHVCQLWGVDPWSNEIYLVQRGKIWTRDYGERKGEIVDNRTWTIQTGIDGYRRRARDASAEPGALSRWIGSAKWYWSGTDDDERSWHPTTDPDSGDIVMKRVWWEAWPASRGNPGMAKAVIRVMGPDGELRTEEFVAHWEMYAAYEAEYEEVPDGRNPNKTRRQKKTDPNTGEVIQKLGTFWDRGGPHMLAKCAEVGVLRGAFHGAFHGVRADEEMSRADVDAKTALEEAVAQQRREAFRATQARPDAPAVVAGTVEADTPAGQSASGPVHVADIPADQVLPALLPEAERHRMILEELDWIGELLSIDDMRASLARRADVDSLDTMTADELLGWVGPFRAAVVIPRLREAGRHAEADSYTAFGGDVIAPPDVLRGLEEPPKVEQTPDQVNDQPHPHPFVPQGDDDSQCASCHGYEDDPQHQGAIAQAA